MRLRCVLRRLTDQPEINVAVFAFLVNYPWEFLRAPFFEGLAAAPHWEAVKLCSLAVLGDAAIAVAALWVVAAASRTRSCIVTPTVASVLGFIGMGLALTAAIERLATGPLNSWAYAETMPVVPLLEIGLAPFLQWILLPPFVVWFVRRQLA